jgi:hypothetical protein
MEAQSVGGGWNGVATGYPLVVEQTWWCLFVYVFITDIRELRPGQWDERALRTSVRPSVFLSFFLSFCLSVRPSVSPSVHLSFFLSLTSPSSPAPFSVSLIYIFLVFFFRAATCLAYSVCVVMYIPLPTCSSLIFFIAKFFCQFAPEIYDFKFQPI